MNATKILDKTEIPDSAFYYEKGHAGNEYIGKKINEFSHLFLSIKGNSFTTGGNFIDDPAERRFATFEEQKWLEACIKTNTFIPLSEINYQLTYEIY